MTFRPPGTTFSLFLDRTVAARRHEKPAGSAIGIIPGNWGKEHGNWCRAPLCGASRVQAYVTSSSGRGRTRSSIATMELSGEARTRSRVRAELDPGSVSDPALMQLPRGLWLLLYNQDVAQRPVGPPHQKARLQRLGAKGARYDGERASLAKLAKPPAWGGAKTASPNCKSKAT